MVNFAHCMRAHGVQMPDPFHIAGHAGLSIYDPPRTSATHAAWAPTPATCGNAQPFRALRPIRARKAAASMERACSGAFSDNGRRAVAVTTDRCSSQYPQLRSGGVGTARARLSSPIT